jgi:hypothetical protein
MFCASQCVKQSIWWSEKKERCLLEWWKQPRKQLLWELHWVGGIRAQNPDHWDFAFLSGIYSIIWHP